MIGGDKCQFACLVQFLLAIQEHDEHVDNAQSAENHQVQLDEDTTGLNRSSAARARYHGQVGGGGASLSRYGISSVIVPSASSGLAAGSSFPRGDSPLPRSCTISPHASVLVFLDLLQCRPLPPSAQTSILQQLGAAARCIA